MNVRSISSYDPSATIVEQILTGFNRRAKLHRQIPDAKLIDQGQTSRATLIDSVRNDGGDINYAKEQVNQGAQ